MPAGDETGKKCADRIKIWNDSSCNKKDGSGNPISIHDNPSILFDGYLLLSMMVGILAVVLQVKILGWVSFFAAIMCATNYRSGDDFRQIYSCFMVSIMSLCMVYGKDRSPLA